MESFLSFTMLTTEARPAKGPVINYRGGGGGGKSSFTSTKREAEKVEVMLNGGGGGRGVQEVLG